MHSLNATSAKHKHLRIKHYKTFDTMILFGYYTFLIKAYMLYELGIEVDEHSKNWQIEVRQKCFHIFWIPFFSLGKVYGLRREDGQLYELPNDLEQAMRNNMVHRTPWYTYIGLLIIILGVGIYKTSEKYEKHKYEAYEENRVKEINNIFEKPEVGDLYTMYKKRMLVRYSAEVDQVKGDSIHLLITKHEQAQEPTTIRGRMAYLIEDLELESQWVTKEEMINARDFGGTKIVDSLALYLPSQGGVNNFKLYSVKRYDYTYN